MQKKILLLVTIFVFNESYSMQAESDGEFSDDIESPRVRTQSFSATTPLLPLQPAPLLPKSDKACTVVAEHKPIFVELKYHREEHPKKRRKPSAKYLTKTRYGVVDGLHSSYHQSVRFSSTSGRIIGVLKKKTSEKTSQSESVAMRALEPRVEPEIAKLPLQAQIPPYIQNQDKTNLFTARALFSIPSSRSSYPSSRPPHLKELDTELVNLKPICEMADSLLKQLIATVTCPKDALSADPLRGYLSESAKSLLAAMKLLWDEIQNQEARIEFESDSNGVLITESDPQSFANAVSQRQELIGLFKEITVDLQKFSATTNARAIMASSSNSSGSSSSVPLTLSPSLAPASSSSVVVINCWHHFELSDFEILRKMKEKIELVLGKITVPVKILDNECGMRWPFEHYVKVGIDFWGNTVERNCTGRVRCLKNNIPPYFVYRCEPECSKKVPLTCQ